MRSIAQNVFVVVAWLFVAALVAQVFLAGLGVFDSPASFATHRDVGYTLSVFPIVLLVAALVGGLGRRLAILSAVVFGLFMLQSVFVLMRDSAPAVAALHPVNGFLIVLLALVMARDGTVARTTMPARRGSTQALTEADRMAGPTTVQAYLATLSAERRAGVEELRRVVAAAAPEATETIAYSMPAFRSHGGQFLVSFAAYKRHYSLFPASEAVIEALGDELKPHLAGSGTIQFRADALSRRIWWPGSSGSGSRRTRLERPRRLTWPSGAVTNSAMRGQ